ncbi:hypothetical protein [Streptomyces sp. DSM 15324]|uniref:hypothetical protein n=1 Tax=Streptomyces sp. DSM 15324 TaxID=1739111 RepID=UPI0007473D9B|nr:hypothetical protein [Streptomyces sp. DSM 15324]KUO07507.1 hypothetical protein AQJ58_35035 [Streptomyces sp. DSM 15324]
MPFPLVPRARSGPRRRTLLASAAGAALLVGCSSGSEHAEEEVAGGSPSVTERARARAAADSGGLLARYDAVLAAHPPLAQRLAPLRAEVVRHVEAFGGGGGPSPTASPSAAQASPTSSTPSASPASPSPSTSSPPATPPPAATGTTAAPVTEKDALAALAAAERELADRRTAELLDVPGELARLLASVAAAGAAHAYLLTEGNR